MSGDPTAASMQAYNRAMAGYVQQCQAAQAAQERAAQTVPQTAIYQQMMAAQASMAWPGIPTAAGLPGMGRGRGRGTAFTGATVASPGMPGLTHAPELSGLERVRAQVAETQARQRALMEQMRAGQAPMAAGIPTAAGLPGMGTGTALTGAAVASPTAGKGKGKTLRPIFDPSAPADDAEEAVDLGFATASVGNFESKVAEVGDAEKRRKAEEEHAAWLSQIGNDERQLLPGLGAEDLGRDRSRSPHRQPDQSAGGQYM
eukprot:gnl/MRDRNA2_/MRDRNA2_33137_c0_seq1.p1 gnl/MRDRNA2_/MRDRNA2_33137_c0~~gnl/MRDRNA2_/MRDRNA2_33137_c0_seq1.p1  ORF type:complete len:280 (-),score=53.29 gnl/MRDRNA2_/MRDRNA2_33137_c0_seq1:68-844(-)